MSGNEQMKYYDDSYAIYIKACDNYNISKESKDSYINMVNDGFHHLSNNANYNTYDLINNKPYIIYKLGDMYIKLKKVENDKIDISFMNQDLYNIFITSTDKVK